MPQPSEAETERVAAKIETHRLIAVEAAYQATKAERFGVRDDWNREAMRELTERDIELNRATLLQNWEK